MNKAEKRLGLLTNFFINHSVTIFVVATVSCLVLIAYFTNHFKPSVFGVWLVVGILTSLLFSGVGLVVVLAVAAVEKARHMRFITYDSQTTVNIKDHFVGERVTMDYFRSLASPVNGKKIFENCEIHGPGSIFLYKSNHLEGCTFNLCDLVVVNETDNVNTAIYFVESIFKACRFSNMVIWLTDDMAKTVIENHRASSGEDLRVVGCKPAEPA